MRVPPPIPVNTIIQAFLSEDGRATAITGREAVVHEADLIRILYLDAAARCAAIALPVASGRCTSSSRNSACRIGPPPPSPPCAGGLSACRNAKSRNVNGAQRRGICRRCPYPGGSFFRPTRGKAERPRFGIQKPDRLAPVWLCKWFPLENERTTSTFRSRQAPEPARACWRRRRG